MRDDFKKNEVGIAFDLGTTTIAGASVDLENRKIIKALSLPNPQVKWGRDVLARVNAVAGDPALLKGLSDSVLEACNSIIRGVSEGRKIREITAAGNPVMEHILLKVSPEPLSKVPYKPVFTQAKRLSAKDAGFEADEETRLYTFPLVSGFVGGDAVAVALCLGLQRESGAALALDIGTNSEILLSSGGVIYGTSAAAGPAFEAGELKYGMTAGNGAIEGVKVDGDDIKLDVIGGAAPRGICGSGLVDAASELLRAGVIDASGRIKDRGEIPTNLSNRIKEGKEGNSFILYRCAKGEVALSQSDIRALQVAKAAIKAGISMLLKKAGLAAGDMEKVYLAGAFGSHLKKEGLGTIGLLNKSWLEKIRSVGDAALDGAVLGLYDEKKKEAEGLADNVKYVSLSGSAHFEREFISNMDFKTLD